ncbi:leukocyte receptor cluster member 1 homolog [Anastrepha obliqua]|uniref:leukocyte receptor cluster member 1 homolog n=1 Tax=Anastrepha obliqua TaxID=95512 RepID=UPI002409722A|nr:leukocyte receptor cluster member 1 homolog [Anastrepha obliqua]
MNILPKKRWHVRTKDNIARVRRDEAEAKEKEQKRQEKLLLAESEARINFLRKKTGLPERHNDSGEISVLPAHEDQQHVDLFADYRSHTKTTNKASEEEKKEEREKYEKQIGYLTYLGQDTNEALKLRSWYEVAPQRPEVGDDNIVEKDVKSKRAQDPLTLINALLPSDQSKTVKPSTTKLFRENSGTGIYQQIPTIKKDENKTKELEHRRHKKGKKHKKHKHKKDKGKKRKHHSHGERKCDSEERQRLNREKLEKLRKERLLREASERARQEELLAPKNVTQELKNTDITPTPRIVQKYNSQFNPEIAKQNII